MQRARLLLRTWPSASWLVWFDRRLGLYLVSLAALYGLKWRNGYDLNAFLVAARYVADGQSSYAGTLATGVGEWGTEQVYVSPPFLAHALAPFSSLPGEAVFVGWNLLGLAALIAATRVIDRDTLAHRMPRLVFGLGYIWATVCLGQVNLFVLAGLLMALTSKREGLAGFGLALATLLRATPLAFGVLLVIDRRWRALGWAAAWIATGILFSGPGEWATYVQVLRDAATLPPLDVSVQASLAQVGPWAVAVAAVALAIVFLLAGRVPGEAALLRGTAIGFALILLPTNSWYHWYAFVLVAILAWGDRVLWSRRSLAAFLVVGFIPMGWPSSLIAVCALAAMVFRVIVPGRATAPEAVTGPVPAG